MIRRNATGIVAPAAMVEPAAQAFLRPRLGDFVEGQPGAKSYSCGGGLVSLNSHLFSLFVALSPAEKVDLISLFQGHVSLFPIRTPSRVSANSAHLAETTGHVDLYDLHLEQRFNRLLDFDLVRDRKS